MPSKPSLGPKRYKLTSAAATDRWILEWDNGKQRSGTFPHKLEIDEKKGFGAKKLDGVLYVVKNTDDKTASVAFFASDESGVTVYEVTKSGKEWDTLGPTI